MIRTVFHILFFIYSFLHIILYRCLIPAEGETQKATFEIRKIDGKYVPFQNKFPYPSFEMQERVYIFLNKNWRFQKTLLNHDLSLKKRTKKTIKELQKESKGRYKKDYNDSNWQKIKIPSVNNPYPLRYQDGSWYRCKFRINKSYKNKIIKLIFQGANYVVDVWINGKWVGMHEGGFTPFIFDITEYISWDEENVIAVRVDNIPWLKGNIFDYKTNKHNIVPYKKVDWWNYGGIYRDVYIEISEKLYIIRADIKAEPLDNKKAKCNINIYIHNGRKAKSLVNATIKIYKAIVNEKNILSPKASDIADFKQRVDIKGDKDTKIAKMYPGDIAILNYKVKLRNIKYWSPEKPVLYVLEVTLKRKNKIIDKFYTQFGIRKIEKNPDDNGFDLNHRNIFLKGVARHEEYIDSGRAISFNDAKKILKDFQFIKDMNANFLRTAHYPNHPLTYILADRVGLAIMEEIPVMWFDGPEFNLQREVRGIARQMWLEMIYRDFNRVSIFFWSTCNECGWQDERREFIWDLKSIAYKIDGTRLVGQSAVGADTRDGTQKDCDYFGATMYYGVFYGTSPYKSTRNALNDIVYYYNKPIIATEYGIWSHKDLSNTVKQIEVATNTYKAFREFPQVGGIVWWCAFDWYTMLGNPYQSMGTITLDRKILKPVYFILQGLYSNSGITPKINIDYPKDGDKVNGIIKSQILIPDIKNIKNVYYRFMDTEFTTLQQENGIYKISFDTRNLKEGKNYLLVKIKYKNGDTFYVKRDIIIDNTDEPPTFKDNLKEGKIFIDKIFLKVEAYDDKQAPEVFYKIDENEKVRIPEINENLYMITINLERFKDKSTHRIEISVKDDSGNIVKEKYNFKIDRSPGIKIELPYNLDRISYNHNRRDAFEWSLPAEELPDSNSWFVCQGNDNIKFFLGPKEDGGKNIIESLGQTLKVKPDYYNYIHFLGYSFWGNQENDLLLIYSDGTKEVQEISFSDWVGATPYMDDHIGILCSHYHCYEGDGDQPVAVYHKAVKCNPDKKLVKIKLPYDNHKHILAISLEK